MTMSFSLHSDVHGSENLYFMWNIKVQRKNDCFFQLWNYYYIKYIYCETGFLGVWFDFTEPIIQPVSKKKFSFAEQDLPDTSYETEYVLYCVCIVLCMYCPVYVLYCMCILLCVLYCVCIVLCVIVLCMYCTVYYYAVYILCCVYIVLCMNCSCQLDYTGFDFNGGPLAPGHWKY